MGVCGVDGGAGEGGGVWEYIYGGGKVACGGKKSSSKECDKVVTDDVQRNLTFGRCDEQ